jgi:hypothetical protein
MFYIKLYLFNTYFTCSTMSGYVSSLRILTFLNKMKNKICVSSLRILTHKFCQSDLKKGSEIYEK